MYKSSLKFLRFHLGFDFQNPFRADTFGSEAPLSGAELTFAKFGSNFFVNLDTAREIERLGGGAPCAAARTERREALFIFCRELPEKRRKENAKI